jgi:hypothetical protein
MFCAGAAFGQNYGGGRRLQSWKAYWLGSLEANANLR